MANNFRIRKSLKRREERAKSGKRSQRTMDSYLCDRATRLIVFLALGKILVEKYSVRWREKRKKHSNNMFRVRVRSRFNDAFCSHVRAVLTVRFMSVSAITRGNIRRSARTCDEKEAHPGNVSRSTAGHKLVHALADRSKQLSSRIASSLYKLIRPRSPLFPAPVVDAHRFLPATTYL